MSGKIQTELNNLTEKLVQLKMEYQFLKRVLRMRFVLMVLQM